MIKLKSTKGFSLVELMIVVAILGVIATIAIPLYRDYVETAREAEAKASLSSIYALQEQYFADMGVYAPGSYTASSDSLANVLVGFEPGSADSLNFDYVVTTVAGTPPTFLAKATYRHDTNKFFTINQDNVREFTDNGGSTMKSW